MRSNTTLLVALLVVAGLIVAGLVGVVGVGMLRMRTDRQAALDRERLAAEEALAAAERAEAAKAKTAPTTKGPAPKPKDPAAPPPAAGQTPAEIWSKADYRVPLETLNQAYNANAVAADQTYKGKKLATVGVVEAIQTDQFGRGIVVIGTGSTDPLALLENVHCTFDAADKDKLAALVQGDTIALVGDCKGKVFLGVALEKCRFVQSAKDGTEMRGWVK